MARVSGVQIITTWNCCSVFMCFMLANTTKYSKDIHYLIDIYSHFSSTRQDMTGMSKRLTEGINFSYFGLFVVLFANTYWQHSATGLQQSGVLLALHNNTNLSSIFIHIPRVSCVFMSFSALSIKLDQIGSIFRGKMY